MQSIPLYLSPDGRSLSLNRLAGGCWKSFLVSVVVLAVAWLCWQFRVHPSDHVELSSETLHWKCRPTNTSANGFLFLAYPSKLNLTTHQTFWQEKGHAEEIQELLGLEHKIHTSLKDMNQRLSQEIACMVKQSLDPTLFTDSILQLLQQVESVGSKIADVLDIYFALRPTYAYLDSFSTKRAEDARPNVFQWYAATVRPRWIRLFSVRFAKECLRPWRKAEGRSEGVHSGLMAFQEELQQLQQVQKICLKVAAFLKELATDRWEGGQGNGWIQQCFKDLATDPSHHRGEGPMGTQFERWWTNLACTCET